MGKMIDVEKLTDFGRFHYRSFQAALLAELRQGCCFRWVTLPLDAVSNLLWYSNPRKPLKWVPLRLHSPDWIIHTDASKVEWGAWMDDWTF